MTLVCVEVLQIGSLTTGVIKVVYRVWAGAGGVMGTTGVCMILSVCLLGHSTRPVHPFVSEPLAGLVAQDRKLTATTHSIALARLLQVLVCSIDL